MTLQAFLIAGPTASGKSALAVQVAQACGGVVINADSMQVYADLRVLSARPDGAELAQAPHALFGHIDGAVNYSAGLWLADVAAALAQARALALMPIITGGTGLYFKALTLGLSQIPPVPEAVRAAVRLAAQGQSPQALHAQLAACDPVMAAKLRPSDPQRILRALEVFAATGQSLAKFQGTRTAAQLPDATGLFLQPERTALLGNIDARFDAMLANGALAEVRALAARALDPALPVMRAHGVPHLCAYLRGETSLDEASLRAKTDTRAYAKRQVTFARHQLPQLVWTTPEAAYATALQMISAARAEKTSGKT